MYKIIIADDERTVREGLSNHIDWEQLGFELVGEFGDGEEVIEYLDSMPVDVVLTDITMPHYSGIEIARYVKESELPCKIVFISGHKDFEMALQAIKYNVEGYITKPTKVEEIKEQFQNLRKKLDQQKQDLAFQNKYKEYWNEQYPMLVDQFVSSLVMGILEDRNSVIQRMHFLYPNIDVERSACFLANVKITNYDACMENDWKYGAGGFGDALYSFVRSLQGLGCFHVIYRSKDKIKLFVLMNQFRDTANENHLLCEQCMEHFAEEFCKQFGATITLKIEHIFENVIDVFNQQGRFYNSNSCREDMELHLYELKKLMLSNILGGKLNAAQKMMNCILKNLQGYDVRYAMSFVLDIFYAISELLREKNEPMYQAIRPFIDYWGMANISTFSEISFYSNRFFERMKSEGDAPAFQKKENLIERFKAYVQDHICEDISLEDAANELYISNTHLSRIIKKEMGETFLQYVTRKKMEKAVELLNNPVCRIYQVSEVLGYKTTRYFSKLFYNYSGYTPTQYRKEVLCIREMEVEE